MIVVGAGLAGTTLAWQLRRRGRSFALVDKAEAVTSSRVAAGLMTPITGKRLTKTWRYDDLFPTAAAFYRGVEAETGARFFHPRPIVRVLKNDRERATFGQKCGEFGDLVRAPAPPLNPDWFPVSDGFEMPTAAQLDVPKYLDASRVSFDEQFVEADVAPEDIAESADGVALPRLGLRADRLIFCQGFAASRNPLTSDLPFRAAKGEILTVRIGDFDERRTVNDGHWLTPAEPDLWRFGATYSWNDFSNTPTAEARIKLEIGLKAMVNRPFEVVDQQAAVRPILAGQKPWIGLLDGSRIGVFNGLGSKGSLMAPHFAGELADRLAD